MSANKLLEQLWNENKEFVTIEELEDFAKDLYYNYKRIIQYLISRGYLLKVIQGIFYVKSDEEIKSKKIKLTYLELISKSLEKKGIHNWYFGLYTALKLNGINNNHGQEVYAINDRLMNEIPMIIRGYNLRFLILGERLLNFGIVENKIKYSNLEKTVLDLIYLWSINKIDDRKIVKNISEFLKDVSKEKIIEYSKSYPENNRILLKRIL